MTRLILSYGSAIAALALLLAWLDYRQAMQLHSTEFYAVAIAVIFAGLGIWFGNRLTAQPRGPDFERNVAVIASLGISPRECEVLDLLAEGCSNKLIARRLSISPNTVKSHVARLFEKLDAESRVQAITKARTLAILP
jgi:DNA-binding CsgD family transcriptional regulator